MQQIVSKTFAPIFTAQPRPRYIICMGGRGTGRSTAASQYANAKLVAPEYFRCAIMRYVLGDIRNSIYREIKDRAEENGVLDKFHVNDSSMTIEYGKNSINAVGFKKSSGDQKAKLKSLANYTTVIIEEADEIPEADFMQLDDTLRTLKGEITIILLLNPPPKSHWIIQRWFDLEPSEKVGFFKPKLKEGITDTLYIGGTYEDNRINLSEQTIYNYERYKTTKPDHYYNMVKGLVPEVVRGRIFNWKEIDDIPLEARLERTGLDYGYSNDPTATVDIYYWNGAYVLDEGLYAKGLSNRMIADYLLTKERKAPVCPDSAEPKSNDELREYGVVVLEVAKGQGSINQGIQFMQAQTIYYTKRSKNIKKEQENYKWKEDKDGNVLNIPVDNYNHLMDGARYGFSTIERIREPDEQERAERLLSRLKHSRASNR